MGFSFCLVTPVRWGAIPCSLCEPIAADRAAVDMRREGILGDPRSHKMAMTGLQPSGPFWYANCILVFQTLAGRSDSVSRRDLNQLTENRVPPRMGAQV